MALVPITPDEEADELQEVLFDHSKVLFGRVANAVRVGSHTPKLMQMLFGFIVASLREEITDLVDAVSYTHLTLPTNREV